MIDGDENESLYQSIYAAYKYDIDVKGKVINPIDLGTIFYGYSFDIINDFGEYVRRYFSMGTPDIPLYNYVVLDDNNGFHHSETIYSIECLNKCIISYLRERDRSSWEGDD